LCKSREHIGALRSALVRQPRGRCLPSGSHRKDIKLPFNVGFALHRPEYVNIFMKALIPYATEVNVLTPANVGALGVSKENAVQGVEAYITKDMPDIVFLEWNLGNSGKEDPTFSVQFFQKYPDITFALSTATSIDEGQLSSYQALKNVNTSGVGKLPAFTVVVQQVIQTATTLAANAPGGNNGGKIGPRPASNQIGNGDIDVDGDVGSVIASGSEGSLVNPNGWASEGGLGNGGDNPGIGGGNDGDDDIIPGER
jgi:hypothetical protein